MTHPRMWVETACRLAPNALAAGLIGLAPGASPAIVPFVQPIITAQQESPIATPEFGNTGMPRPLPVDASVASAVSREKADDGDNRPTRLIFPLGDVKPVSLASVILAPYLAPPDSAELRSPAHGIIGASFPISLKAESVPEPSSLLVLVSALCGLFVLIRATQRRRLTS